MIYWLWKETRDSSRMWHADWQIITDLLQECTAFILKNCDYLLADMVSNTRRLKPSMTLLSRAVKLTDFGLNCYYGRRNDWYTGIEIHTQKSNEGGREGTEFILHRILPRFKSRSDKACTNIDRVHTLQIFSKLYACHNLTETTQTWACLSRSAPRVVRSLNRRWSKSSLSFNCNASSFEMCFISSRPLSTVPSTWLWWLAISSVKSWKWKKIFSSWYLQSFMNMNWNYHTCVTHWQSLVYSARISNFWLG